MIIFHIETRRRLRCCSEPWTGFRLLPWDRKNKKDRTGLVFSVILDTLIISQAPLLSQDVIYYALTLSLRNFRIKRKRAETEHPLPIIVDWYGLTMMKYSKSLC